MTDTANLATASDSELDQVANRIQAERARRAGEDQAARAARFRQELDEVRAGMRAMQDEHVAYLSPREVETCVNRGQVHGIAPDRRLRRGQ